MSFFEKVLQIYISRWPWFLELIGEQLKISLIAVLIAGVLGMLLGIFISEHRRFAEPVMAVCNVFYTIPAIALIGLLIPLIGIGERNAIIAIVLYGIMPMVRNTYTDMTAVADQLIFGGNPDYIEREDGFQAVVKTYGYNFKDIKSIDIGLKYAALANASIDVTNGYTTDAQLGVQDVVALEDDQHLQVNYFCSTVVREDALEKYPGLEEALMLMDGLLSDSEMAGLNAKVEGDGLDEAAVAHDYLVEKGILKG